MLDLSFGLPIVVRDAALKMVAPGPDSSINREFFAQNNEKELEEGRGGLEAYEKTDEKARDLLRRLANSEAYKRESIPGPVRGLPHGERRDYGEKRDRADMMPGSASAKAAGRAKGLVFSKPPGPEDIIPPKDQNITSLFITGVEDDLPEHIIRSFFAEFGTLRSVVCSHRSHCAFINFQNRQGAEAAAEALQGKAVLAGCPLRVRWGRPKPLGTMEEDERNAMRREGKAALRAHATTTQQRKETLPAEAVAVGMDIEKPPGADDFRYASQAGA